MDTSLLAFARPRRDAPPPSPDTMADNMRQLVQLRWIAVAGQLVTICVVHFGFGVPLPLAEMLTLVALLAAANLGTLLFLGRHRVRSLELTFSLLIDMTALAAQLFLSGGTGNPFSLLFLLQVVLGAILLERGSVWLLALVAAFFYGGLSILYRPLVFPPGLAADARDVYTLGSWLAFAIAALLLILFIGRISSNLRAREAYLVELQARAVEEESIVRMGLFASGAAHELGTPLATLSVILGDWRRIKRIARDPELAADVEEMRAEVDRCKAIVSDILRSAGEPRGEAMASAPAADFLQALADEWRATSPGTVLETDWAGLGATAVVTEPALRQAVWNLLENAAEVSPGSILLRAERRGGTLVIAVRDRGPGFAADAQAGLGQPFRSTKGPGRGVGLFLAANTARQLGGRLEAVNLPGGGAEVRIEIPDVGGGAEE